MVDLNEKSVLRNGYTLGVFFVIEGAFDNVLTHKVVEGLINIGVPNDITNWYQYYLTNRTVSVKLGTTTRVRSLHRGTPQGGSYLPWSGILYLMVY